MFDLEILHQCGKKVKTPNLIYTTKSVAQLRSEKIPYSRDRMLL